MPGGEEHRTLAGHGVLVTAGQIEGAAGDGGQIGRHGEEPVIAIDDYNRIACGYRINEGG